MAKNKISEYSSTAANNTDVANINIAEGCSPSNINNAIRAVMGHLKDLQSGTSGDTIPVTAGGTGSGTASGARTNLGLGALSVLATVDTAQIDDDAITTAKILNANVTNAKMATDSVDTTQIVDDAVTSAKIAANAVDATALNVSGNGTSGQALLSDGDGSFSWGANVTGNNQANGHFKLSNGLIVNWGNTGTLSNGSYAQITFDQAYSTAMYGFYAFTSIGNSYTGGSEQWTTNRTTSGLRLYHRGFDTYLGSNEYWWISVGY